MINKPSLLDTPNLINWKEFTPSDIPGSSVDDCYANDSVIRTNYDGTDTAEWNTGKQVQETLPAAEWDAWMHDLNAYGWQITEIINSIYDEIYSVIHGQQTGMAHQLLDAIETNRFNARSVAWVTYGTDTFATVSALITAGKIVCFNYSNGDGTTDIYISVDSSSTSIVFSCLRNALIAKALFLASDNTWGLPVITNIVERDATQTLTNKTISFNDNTLTNVASLNTAQTLTNKTMSRDTNIFLAGSGYDPTTNATITVDREMTITLTSSSTLSSYTISAPPTGQVGLVLTIYCSGAHTVVFPDALTGTSVTKTLTAGVHHLTSAAGSIWGWCYVELSGTYTDNTTFTYLL